MHSGEYDMEDYIRQMWRFLPIPIAYISPLGIILEVDEDMEKLIGYSREDLAGKSLFDYCSEKEKMAQVQEWTLNGRPVKNYEECSLINAQGQKILVSLSTLVRMDEELRKPIGYFATFIDITERKQAEEKHQAIIKTALDGFWLVDVQGRFLDVNDSYCQLVGYSRDELLKMSIPDVEAIENPEETAERIAKIIKVGRDRFETRHRHKDGKIIDVEISVNYLNVGGGQFFVFVRDITERKRMEAEIKLFSDAVAGATDAISITDMEGIITYVNPAMEEIYGYEKGELIGKHASILTANQELSKQLMSTLLKTGRWDGEIEQIKKNKETFPALLSLSAVRDENGNPIAHMGTIRDITGRKQAEERIQELYNEEKKLRQEIEAEVDKRIEFTRTLVHELKTPLTPMMAASELLMEEIPEGSLLRLAKSINQGANTLNRRIGELLDVAKGELGILELDCKEINLLELLRKVGEDITPLASSRDQRFNPELPVSLPPVWGDEERLRQVVVNLLDNSFKFTPEGGKITLRAKEKDEALIVEVEDTGRGIPVDQQRHLFEAYYHVESEKRPGMGLGLGLALSKILVELHGGKIWVESREGKGSKFGFSVPLPSGAR